MELALFFISPLIVAVVVLLWLLDSVSQIKRVLPGWVAEVQRSLSNIITGYLGDVWVYVSQPWEASQVRERFEKRFREIDSLMDGTADSVFVIAHSLGCVVSYEALSSRRIVEYINAKFGSDNGPSFHYFTVGSALPAIWAVAPDGERYRFERKLPDAVRWLDLRSEFDLVPSGPFAGVGHEPERPPRYRRETVVNQMDALAGHTAYWNNAEEVLAPILDAVTARRMHGRLNLNKGARKVRVRVLAAWKALAWMVFPAVFLPLLWAGGGGWTSAWTQQNFLEGSAWQRFFTPLFWSAVASLVAVFVYSTLVKWVWDGWDSKEKYKPAEGQSTADRGDSATEAAESLEP